MIPSQSPCYRRGSLIAQLDFEDFLAIDRQPFLHQTTTLDNSLQVVPDILRDETLHLQRDLTDLHFTWPRITVGTTQGDSLLTTNPESYPRSPFLPRTSISEIDNLGLLSPLFSLSNTASPALKTPSTLYEICCNSSRKSSDDLSIYLPDNFTPASLESLDKSVNRTVFQFPTIPPAKNENVDDVFVEVKSEKLTNDSCADRITQHEYNAKQPNNNQEILVVDDKKQLIQKLDDIASVKEKRAKSKRKNRQVKTNNAKRQKHDQNNEYDIDNKTKEPSPIHRNKMERERRSDLNNRFQKLRDSMPDEITEKSTSKVAILKTASSYIEELISEEKQLDELSKTEKKRNEELLKKLVDINHTIYK